MIGLRSWLHDLGVVEISVVQVSYGNRLLRSIYSFHTAQIVYNRVAMGSAAMYMKPNTPFNAVTRLVQKQPTPHICIVVIILRAAPARG